MHLVPNQLLFGVAPSLIVDCAKQLLEGPRAFSVKDFSIALGAPIQESEPVLRAMLETGYVESDEVNGSFRATKRLGQLALAKISVGISRGEADVLLGRVIEKAAQINTDGADYAYAVSCIVVFGSYLSTKPHLGDLDLGVGVEELAARNTPPESSSMGDWFRRANAARNRTLRALRLREPKKISLHEIDEVLRLRTPHKVVFGTVPKSHERSGADSWSQQ